MSPLEIKNEAGIANSGRTLVNKMVRPVITVLPELTLECGGLTPLSFFGFPTFSFQMSAKRKRKKKAASNRRTPNRHSPLGGQTLWSASGPKDPRADVWRKKTSAAVGHRGVHSLPVRTPRQPRIARLASANNLHRRRKIRRHWLRR